MSRPNPQLVSSIVEVLRLHPGVQLAILFGSAALGREKPGSDLDIAVDVGRGLTAEEKMALVGELAGKTGRPVDLVDLRTVGVRLLGQILKHGVRILGSTARYGDLIYRYLLDAADFMPYRTRILRERRREWTAK